LLTVLELQQERKHQGGYQAKNLFYNAAQHSRDNPEKSDQAVVRKGGNAASWFFPDAFIHLPKISYFIW